ncbi:MAG: anti-phage deoxyguanosine triphosphatase [Ferrimonas sp.]
MKTIWQERRLPDHSVAQHDYRSRYQRDKARVLHSAAFRRLQAKTQVLGTGLNDFHRTRLTHSIEAAQIGTGINAHLRHHYPEQTFLFDDHLIEALCLAHDIGHPPFGHGGEVALNAMMRHYGGFEGNGQTLRIVSKLEPYTEQHGMNLTRRTMLGLLKYPVPLSHVTRTQSPNLDHNTPFIAKQWQPAKGIYDLDNDILDWILAPLSHADRDHFISLANAPTAEQHGRSAYKSIDCAVMELADDIAYSVHDLEDAITLGIISASQWQQQVVDALVQSAQSPFSISQWQTLSDALFSNENFHRKHAIGTLVNGLVTAVNMFHLPQFSEPLLAYRVELNANFAHLLERLKRFVFDNVIRHTSVQRLEFKGQQMLTGLFHALATEPERLLPSNTRLKWQQAQAADPQQSMRVIADYLGNMSDDYAIRLYHELFMGARQANGFIQSE